MMTTKDITKIIINEMTQGRYDGITPDPDEFYLLTDAEPSGTKQISIAGTTTAGGYSVPNPTPEEMTAIYNAVVAGKSVQIVDRNDVYYQVMLADSMNGAINVEILFFGEMSILYTLEGNTVEITATKFATSADIGNINTALDNINGEII